MDYITRDDALQILKNMNMFETGLKSFFARFEYDLHKKRKHKKSFQKNTSQLLVMVHLANQMLSLKILTLN